jgi:hypothetical protein
MLLLYIWFNSIYWSTSKHWTIPRITQFAWFRALRSIETARESRILRCFEHFEALTQPANHAYCVVSTLRSIETGRESRILRGFEHFEALKQAANHAYYEVSTNSKHWNRPRITHFTRFRALRSIGTRRESRIIRGFEHFEALKQAANHAFYEVSSTSNHWNTPRITHFTRFRALRSIETGRESRILRGFDEFKALKQAANHAFYEVSMKSKHW